MHYPWLPGHGRHSDYNVWKKCMWKIWRTVPRQNFMNLERSVYVPVKSVANIKGNSVIIGGIKSLDPPCLGKASLVDDCDDWKVLEAENRSCKPHQKSKKLKVTNWWILCWG